MNITRQEDEIIFNRITKTTHIKAKYLSKYPMPGSDKVFIIFYSAEESVVIYDVPNDIAARIEYYADKCKANADQTFILDITATHLQEAEEFITKYRLDFYQGTTYYSRLEFLRSGCEPKCGIL